MVAEMNSLTAKEKETLRLLVSGHDAKSIARELDLSVHTINDRLRECRRKLGVTSSREAARILAESEEARPKIHGGKNIGMANTGDSIQSNHSTTGISRKQILFGGGIAMLSFLTAAVFFASPNISENANPSTLVNEYSSTNEGEQESASLTAAKKWLKMVDGKDWQGSWRTAGAIFQAQVSQQGWETAIVPVREPLGKLETRSLGEITQTTSLPGVPTGNYEVIEFQSSFANKSNAVETVVLSYEDEAWRTVGYFIR